MRSRLGRRARRAALIAALVGALAPVPTSAATSDSLPVGAFENMSPDHAHARTEAIAHAQRFDVIVATRNAYRDYVADMKATNPRLVLLAYMNGTFAQETQGSTFPSTWYLRDSSGNKVRSRAYGNYLMNPNNAAWRRNRADFCLSLLAKSRYDGCSIDMLGAAPLEPGYLTSQPVNPATGQAFTGGEWMRATAAVAADVKAALGSRPVYANGLRNGVQYFDDRASSEVLLDAANGGIAESWLRASTWSITKHRSEAEWRRDVDLIVDAEGRGDAVVTLTKVWTSGTTAQKDAWHEYALASFLMGSGGRSRFSFSYDRNAPATSDHPWWHVNIGTPSARYGKINGVYQRPYTAGKVLVNPTDAPVTVSLGAAYTDFRGNRMSSLTLPPHSGKVLKKV